ncbi:Alpha/Beta hydrolase protein [Aspergillus heterothallicus]
MTQSTPPAPKLTPQTLLTSPIRSHITPNKPGTLAVYTEQTNSLTTHAVQRSIRVVETKTPRYWVVTSNPNVSFPQWLGDSDDLVWLEYLPRTGQTQLVVGSAWLRGSTYVAGVIEGKVRDLTVTGGIGEAFGQEDQGDLLFAMIGGVTEAGGVWNPVADSDHDPEKKQRAECEEDEDGHKYEEKLKNVIWFGNLVRPSLEPDARYCLMGVTNLMSFFNLGLLEVENVPASELEKCQEFFVNPFVILFVGKDPEVDPATHTACSCYACPMMTWDAFPIPDNYYKAFRHRGLGGKISSPYAEPDGGIVFLSQKKDGYAADKNRIVLVGHMSSARYTELFASNDGEGLWDLSPSAVSFASDRTMLIQVEERGVRVLYQLPHVLWTDKPTPAHLRRIDTRGSVIDVTPVPDSSYGKPNDGTPSESLILVSSHDFMYSRIFHQTRLTGDDAHLIGPGHPLSQFGLSASQVDQISYPGATGCEVHAWVIKPSFFILTQKYPLAFFIHDGPHDSWNRGWNRSCNLALFAEQGYIVFAPNVSGSTGYGQQFTDSTRYSVAGAPYIDLERGFEYIKSSLSYIETSRAVALGYGSYGGYLINWLQGHSLGRQFRALVSDNGIFSLVSHLSTPVRHPIYHELGGAPWQAPGEWRMWDPACFDNLGQWETPQMIIHGKRNKHVPISDAKAAYSALQGREIESCLLVLDDEGYSEKREPEDLVLWYRSVLEWMRRFTQTDEVRGKSSSKSKIS